MKKTPDVNLWSTHTHHTHGIDIYIQEQNLMGIYPLVYSNIRAHKPIVV